MRAVICGAGIAGLAAAARLHHHGWEVCVVEKAPGPRPQGYMIDFFGPGYETLGLMGLRSRLHELGRRVDGIEYIDSEERVRARVDYAAFEKAAKGEIVSLLRPDLELLLRETVGDKVDLRYATTIDHIDDTPGGATVTLSDGSIHDADMVVGADGIHSHVRSLVFGPEQDYLYYLGMHTAAFVFDDPETARRVDRKFVMLDDVDAQLGLYTTRDDRVAVFAVHRSPDMALPADPREVLQQRFQHLGGLARRALAHCPPSDELYYDQVAQIELPRWSNGHTVLLGDAAYAVSLIAGQGASLGVTGAYVLAERLAAADSVPEALDDFERRVRSLVDDRQAVVRRRGANVFLPSSPLRLRLRYGVMKALRLPGTSRLLRNGLIGKFHTPVADLSA
ncbi:2-polyprenyl-6-methoxyphenol hydroxylase-like FAD-dependent oxidoreductase [Lipingzhangella halophila]|uniref:2-polyprenyl-6-methoxyphenol hydroxylase-like FAD-dependent oxidoreductase n=1 Tax=Lipingzhangella halophila TaxID=1783352 RepID=A0A7W7REK0_9ACTN|nr:FAD-dependent monooxygenase [Lipingzhangella halophila]MBB4929981.1 2-polyprenyl-6-methoxyphenol hydroxylase-like FAD-dependent oxidoreductase [Lipingzhangella halophila]